MSEPKLTRREARENAFLAAFAATFEPDQGESELVLDTFALRLLKDMQTHQTELDAVIEAHLKGWTLARVPRVCLVALRLALAESLYGEEKKTAVAITEAGELVKKYGAESDYQFVNGLLGTVAREQGETPSC